MVGYVILGMCALGLRTIYAPVFPWNGQLCNNVYLCITSTRNLRTILFEMISHVILRTSALAIRTIYAYVSLQRSLCNTAYMCFMSTQYLRIGLFTM